MNKASKKMCSYFLNNAAGVFLLFAFLFAVFATVDSEAVRFIIGSGMSMAFCYLVLVLLLYFRENWFMRYHYGYKLRENVVPTQTKTVETVSSLVSLDKKEEQEHEEKEVSSEPVEEPVRRLPDNIAASVPPNISCSVILIRDGKHVNDGKNMCVDKIEAVKEYICKLDSTKHLHLQTQVTLNETGSYVIDNDVYALINTAKPDGSIDLVLYSFMKPLSALVAWIDKVHQNQVQERDNQLGGRLFYFEEIPCEPPRDCSYRMDPGVRKVQKRNPLSGQMEICTEADPVSMDRPRYRWDQANKHLQFSMLPFDTFKTMDNLYGDHLAELREKLNIFTTNQAWYIQRGLPHHLGILMYGAPGTGKTSTIKAIAADTGRHPMAFKLRRYTTQTQLRHFFYSDAVNVLDTDKCDKKGVTYHMQQDKRLYVLEDVDCLTDIVLDRSTEDAPGVSTDGDAITLSFFLNLLDGILETPGRLIIMTTNHPERLDPALLRPGRVDVQICLKNASTKTIAQILSNFYNVDVTEEELAPYYLDEVFTPAEVISTCMKHHSNFDNALASICQDAFSRRAALAAMVACSGPEHQVDRKDVVPIIILDEDDDDGSSNYHLRHAMDTEGVPPPSSDSE
jgi:hypothetical protein